MNRLATTIVVCMATLALLAGPNMASADPLLLVDVNSIRSSQTTNPSPTQAGFSAFDANDTGGSPQMASINGHNVTLTAIGGAVFQTRDRQGVLSADFTTSTYGDLYRDGIQADGGNNLNTNPNDLAGINLQIDNLDPDTTYDLRLWTHDVFAGGNANVTITDNNTSAVIGGGQWSTTLVPTDLSDSRFDVLAMTDATGLLNVDIRHDGAVILGALPLNGFQLNQVPEPSGLILMALAGCVALVTHRWWRK